MKTQWHAINIDSVLTILGAKKSGLTSSEAQARLEEYGSNVLPVKKPITSLKVFLRQFKSPLIFLLVFAGFIELYFHGYVDAIFIFTAVIINTFIGFFQEYKAENALHQLRNYISYNAKVYRDQQISLISSNNLVPGDIIIIEAGDRVPADGRIIESDDLEINEASLTGESMAVKKSFLEVDGIASVGDRRSMAYMGTTVVAGRGLVVVTETGVSTNIGEVANLIQKTEETQTPLQEKIKKLGSNISIIVLIIAILILLEGLFRGNSFVDMLETAVAVSVAAIPEGLVISITVILTLGMQKILKHKALVRSLLSTETLGSTTVICSDKTGTLTEGVMKSVSYWIPGHDVSEVGRDVTESGRRLFIYGLLCNDSLIRIESGKKIYIGDSTDSAVLSGASDIGLDIDRLRKEYLKYKSIPFNSDEKMMVSAHHHDGSSLLVVKGAVDTLIKKSSFIRFGDEIKKIDSKERKNILQKLESLSAQGLRVIGLATSDKKIVNEKINDIDFLIFEGMIAIADPLRQESKAMINIAKKAGIKTIIITGDHALTVSAIATQLGYDLKPGKVVVGADLDDWSDEELFNRVSGIDIFARVSPRHKIRIVMALQKRGEVVAMLGDGVNDAPALKAADIGVVVGSGTDVAKETADIVLLDDNFKTVIMAVRQGRMIMDNIRKVIVYLLVDSFSEVILISGALVMGLPLPLTALQILYINIITDGLPNFALAFEPGEDDVMSRQSINKKDGIITKQMKTLIFLIGIITDLGLFALYFFLLSKDMLLVDIRTLLFMALGIDSLLYVFSCKSFNKSIFSTKIFSNKYLIGAVVLGGFLQFLPLMIAPLGQALEISKLHLNDWMIIIGIAFIKLFAIEIAKLKFFNDSKKYDSLPA